MIHKSKFIKNLSEVKELIAHCKETGYASIDYETNAREPKDPEFRPTIISVSFQPGSAWVIPLAHKDSIFKRKWKQVFKLFASEVLQDRTIIKIAWNAKFEQKVSMALGYRIMGRLFDPMLLKYLLDETPPNDLKSQVDFLLPEFGGYDLENQPGKKASREAKINFWENVPLKELSKYGALDADLAFRLFLHYDKRVMEIGLYHYSRNFYGPLTHILAETELLGVQVDRVYLEGQVKSFADKLDKLEASIRSIPFIRDYEEDLKDRRIAKYIEELEEEIDYGDLTQAQINNRLNKISKLELGVPTTNKEQKLFDPINFNSTTQLAELLYGDDGFGFECTEFTETGNPSCGESALKALRGEDDSGFINSLLEHRELTKMYTTYLKGIYENHLTDWGTIHPGYLLQGTSTGRFSSRNPSFQTMPRSTTAAEIKRQFTMGDGFFFVEFDGSQMELRMAAELSGDDNMLSIFHNNQNIHAMTAALLTGKPYELINSLRKDENHPDHLWAIKEHKKAKVLNFTILYGAGPPTVSEFVTDATGTFHSKADAQEMIDQWFEAYPKVAQWIKKQHKFSINHGYLVNPFGRRRRFPILLNPRNKNSQQGLWNEALRQGPNAVIQGGSSDITQWVNISIQRERLKGNLPGYMRLISTVHDSLEYPIHKDDMAWVLPKVIELASSLKDMKKYMGWTMTKVQMKFSCEFGINWGTMHEFDPGKKHKDLDFSKFYEEELERYGQEPYPHKWKLLK